ncbi:hypothetical protein [Streptomyces sp. H27-D2]|uniref:hypothetical protein n=1 Tax=Streptomyces sp. H27-D2 TaxID=3046304 RepID=UPI002DB6BADD|nr:hypothetical protein [Streptomyces sp. H27-D2]MEC4017789.1 hypothetical protein [Streptomyces sp. H27-D2]
MNEAADQEQGGIAGRLADAAQAAIVGPVPYEAVVRGGRRRTARRWAVAGATALVIAGSTGTLALAGVVGGADRDGTSVAASASASASAEQRHVFRPQRTTLGSGRDGGHDWKVTIEVWGAPKADWEAVAQYREMAERGDAPRGHDGRSPSRRNGWHFVHVIVDGKSSTRVQDENPDPEDKPSGHFESYELAPDRSPAPTFLVGQVERGVEQVVATWKGGSLQEVGPVPKGQGFAGVGGPMLVPVKGMEQENWFAIVEPKNEGPESVTIHIAKKGGN